VRTPIFVSRFLSELTGSRVVLKAENLQKTGSFKIRGASAKLAALGANAAPGIVVASAGNHAQAAALAHGPAGVRCEVYMPAEASVSKAEATIGYGAFGASRGRIARRLRRVGEERARKTGLHFVHPFDDPAIVAGQGTLGLELVEDVDDLAMVIVPLGGGGLVSGIACAIDALAPGVRVVAVQAELCAPVFSPNEEVHPKGDGQAGSTLRRIAVKRPSGITVGLIERACRRDRGCRENDIGRREFVMLLMRSKLVSEGAGPVGGGRADGRPGDTARLRHDGVVLSGGNVDTGLLSAGHPAPRDQRRSEGRPLARIPGPAREPRRCSLPSAKAGEPRHRRAPTRKGYDLQVRETGVHIVLETRNREHAQRF